MKWLFYFNKVLFFIKLSQYNLLLIAFSLFILNIAVILILFWIILFNLIYNLDWSRINIVISQIWIVFNIILENTFVFIFTYYSVITEINQNRS